MLTYGMMIKCLLELAEALHSSGVEGEMIMFGGASMCLVHNARHSTHDIDALYKPEDLISPQILRIALKYDLPVNWLNDTGSVFIKDDPPKDAFIALEGLKIFSVTPQYLLAMKIMAGRDEQDLRDSLHLMGKLNLTTEREVADLMLSFYDSAKVDDRILSRIRAVLKVMNSQESGAPESGAPESYIPENSDPEDSGGGPTPGSAPPRRPRM
jgi:hypothetical protein